ncbi:hypothetical protein [Scytonema sp. PRP1]|uniref:hypothetical protein n=1 Tax=Scytonema sp. PRP1 TaxID=3120513 RepID=UPI002FD073AE
MPVNKLLQTEFATELASVRSPFGRLPLGASPTVGALRHRALILDVLLRLCTTIYAQTANCKSRLYALGGLFNSVFYQRHRSHDKSLTGHNINSYVTP